MGGFFLFLAVGPLGVNRKHDGSVNRGYSTLPRGSWRTDGQRQGFNVDRVAGGTIELTPGSSKTRPRIGNAVQDRASGIRLPQDAIGVMLRPKDFTGCYVVAFPVAAAQTITFA